VRKLQLYQNSLFDQLRLRQDDLADAAVSTLIQNPKLTQAINSWKTIHEVLPEDFPADLLAYFEFYVSQDWTKEALATKGAQCFFDQKGDIYLAMLGFYSLPYCYAFGDGAEVLVRSKRIIHQIGERLGETGCFVLDVFHPGPFHLQHPAILACAKVRLIHAYSRYFIHQYAKDWDPAFGQPINQEDMLGTNLAFSFIVLRGLTKLGFKPTEQEYREILIFWKKIGELMGIDVNYWPETAKEAFELDKLIRSRHLKQTQAGRVLIESLINYYQKTIPDSLLQNQVRDILVFFLGKSASQALGLGTGKPISGDLLGLLFQYSGWKNFGGKKGHQAIRREMEKQQMEQFGKVPVINLPVMNLPS
jgi:hypothetical protein